MTDAQHDDTAGVHAWTDQLARIRFGTQQALGKTVSGARIKAVGERMAGYGTYATGADVRPGLARIAVDLEMDYRTVKAAAAVLVRVGLLRLARPASRPGDADDYQLVIPADLLDRTDVEVWSPARHLVEMEKVRAQVRGKYKRPDLRGPDGPEGEEAAGATGTAQPVDNSVPAGATRAADHDSPDTPAGAAEAADIEPAGATRADLRPYRPLPPPSDRVDNYDLPTSGDLSTEAAGPRATAQEPDSDVVDATANPHWRTLPAYGQLDPSQAARNTTRAAEARAALARPHDARPAPDRTAFEQLLAATEQAYPELPVEQPSLLAPLDNPQPEPAPVPAEPSPAAGPAPADRVWIATLRRGIQAHRLVGNDFTACRRSTRTGDILRASVLAAGNYDATWCKRCWPATALRSAS